MGEVVAVVVKNPVTGGLEIVQVVPPGVPDTAPVPVPAAAEPVQLFIVKDRLKGLTLQYRSQKGNIAPYFVMWSGEDRSRPGVEVVGLKKKFGAGSRYGRGSKPYFIVDAAKCW